MAVQRSTPGAAGRRIFTALLVLVLVAPALVDRDSFPLSTYPMYSRSRGDVVGVATANGVQRDGSTVRLSLGIVGDIDDPLIVQALVRDAIARGPMAIAELCDDVAGRVARSRPADGDIEAVVVVTERHDVVERAAGRPSLESDEVHARCEVGR